MSGFGYNVLGFGGGGLAAEVVDDEFNRVSFLSHFEGANNGVNNAHDDGSTSNHTITTAGRAWQGSFGPFARPDGEWSVSLDGDGDSLTVAASNDFDLSDGDITWEMFVNPSNLVSDGGNQLTLFEYFNSGAFFRFIIYVVDGSFNISIFQRYDGDYPLSAEDVAPANTWTHVACTRDSNNEHKIFVNGVTVATSTNNNDPMPTAGLPLNIGLGQLTPGDRYFPGHISNFRLTKGSLVYTSDFTPPSGPLTAITNCKLLTCQSNNFVDNSASAHTVTPSGNASISAFGPFLTNATYDPAVNGASTYFRGNGDYLSAPDSADWNLGNGLFTAEAWVYPTAYVAQAIIMGQWRNPYAWTILFKNDTTGKIRFIVYDGGFNDYTSSAAVPLNAWSHVALSRAADNVFSLYLNGVRVLTATNNTTVSDVNSVLLVGGQGDQNYWKGYITDARLVKGTAVYSGASLTVPTAPLTAITNTKLLLNMADGQIIDNTAQGNARQVGSPVISTAQAKFGSTSLSLSGSSSVKFHDNTVYGKQSLAFGPADFTVEFWYYGDSVQNDYLFDTRLSTDNEPRASVYFNSNSKLSYFTSNTTRITSTTALTDNTWTHIALVRSSGVTRFYFDGTQDNQSFTDTIDYPLAQLVIGSKYNGTAFITGYFDEFRVSNIARYTSSFTAPSKPFPDKGKL